MTFVFQCVDYSVSYDLRSQSFPLSPRGVYNFLHSSIFDLAYNSPVFMPSFRRLLRSWSYKSKMSVSDFITFYEMFSAGVFLFGSDVQRLNSFCFIVFDNKK